MDRFIGYETLPSRVGTTNLKSNMDRFIEANKNGRYKDKILFKIQYG